jgi:predicted alpha/beta-hydrolase family hydrolase
MPDLAVTEDGIRGIVWRSSANSAPGNMEGVRVPTLVLAGTCSMHLVANEIAFEHAAAADKEFVALEGANHYFQPCAARYGDTVSRAMAHVDGWLLKPGRF